MTKVDIKGIAKVTAKGTAYYYAWRGGPRLRGLPGSVEFMQSYQEAIVDRRATNTDRFRSIITLYKASPDYAKLGNSTRKNWAPWLDRVSEYFGDLRIAQLTAPKKSGQSFAAGATNGPTSLGPPTTAYRFFPARFPLRLTRSA